MSDTHYLSPETLIEELGIIEPGDIDVEAIAYFCKARVVYERLRGCSARLLGYRDRAIISVDSQAPRARQRFSAMHELGHWMLDRGKACFSCTESTFASNWSDNSKESRANRYAANVLLPAELFVSLAENKEVTFSSVRSLAELFGASLTSTAIRLVELGSFPAMLVCTQAGRRKWFVRGPSVPDSVWPCDQPGQDSVAFELHAGKACADRPIDLGAENWVSLPRSRSYTVREHSIRSMDNMVLSLIWWKNERQLLDLDEDR